MMQGEKNLPRIQFRMIGSDYNIRVPASRNRRKRATHGVKGATGADGISNI